MKRIALFVLLLVAFLVWTFPHRLLVERFIKGRLAELSVDVAVGQVGPAWPPGYTIRHVVLSHVPYSMEIDDLRLDVGLGGDVRFEASACGGSLQGELGPAPRDRAARSEDKRLRVDFVDLDPATCMQLDGLVIGGRFAGELELDALGRGNPSGVLGELAGTGSLSIEARQGTIAGSLPVFRPGGRRDETGPQGLPIGTWQFARVDVDAHMDGTNVIIDDARALAEGVSWELTRGRLAAAARSGVSISGDFRARRNDDSPRAKAIVGLLPKATQNEDGWRRYRVSGTLDAPRLIGLK